MWECKKNQEGGKGERREAENLETKSACGLQGTIGSHDSDRAEECAEPGHLAIPRRGRTGWQLMKVLPTPAKDRDAKFTAKARQLESQGKTKTKNSPLQSQPRLGWSKEGQRVTGSQAR